MPNEMKGQVRGAIAADATGRFVKFPEKLGEGAFKEVFRAVDTEQGTDVAWVQLKVNPSMPPHQQAHLFEALRREVELLRQLDHPHVLKLLAYWLDEHSGLLVFVTEYMSSGNLKQYLKRNRSVKVKVVKQWLRQLLDGLEYLHSKGIVHRDIKCANLFIEGTNGTLKIGDLGFAVMHGDASRAALIPHGTPAFFSPEIAEYLVVAPGTPGSPCLRAAASPVWSDKVDIWALGMCLLEMLTDQYPYMECGTVHQLYKKVAERRLPACLDLVRDPEVRDFLEKCFSPNSERPSAAELRRHPFLSAKTAASAAKDSVPLDSLCYRVVERRISPVVVSESRTPPTASSSDWFGDVSSDNDGEGVDQDDINSAALATRRVPAMHMTRPEEQSAARGGDVDVDMAGPHVAVLDTALMHKSAEYTGLQLEDVLISGIVVDRDLFTIVMTLTFTEANAATRRLPQRVEFDYSPAVDTAQQVAVDLVAELALDPIYSATLADVINDKVSELCALQRTLYAPTCRPASEPAAFKPAATAVQQPLDELSTAAAATVAVTEQPSTRQPRPFQTLPAESPLNSPSRIRRGRRTGSPLCPPSTSTAERPASKTTERVRSVETPLVPLAATPHTADGCQSTCQKAVTLLDHMRATTGAAHRGRRGRSGSAAQRTASLSVVMAIPAPASAASSVDGTAVFETFFSQ